MRASKLIFAGLLALAMGCGGGDDGGGGNGDGGVDPTGDGGSNPTIDANNATPTAYRVTTMELMDPPTLARNIVNGLIDDNITMDGDDPPDGNLDLNIVIVHRPLNQAGAGTDGEVAFPDCTAPVDTTACTLPAGGQSEPTMLTNSASGTCLDVESGTATGGQTVVATAAPCFATEAENLTVQLGTITLPLIDAQLGGRYVNDPADALDNGLIKGYLTEETADMTILPDDIIFFGGMPISAVLRDENMDTGPNGETGWWFYLHYTADEAPYTVE